MKSIKEIHRIWLLTKERKLRRESMIHEHCALIVKHVDVTKQKYIVYCNKEHTTLCYYVQAYANKTFGITTKKLANNKRVNKIDTLLLPDSLFELGNKLYFLVERLRSNLDNRVFSILMKAISLTLTKWVKNKNISNNSIITLNIDNHFYHVLYTQHYNKNNFTFHGEVMHNATL